MRRDWVWFDLENTPHVLVLEPLIRGLRGTGRDVRVTAKRQSQTLDLAAQRGLTVEAIGPGDFVSFTRKVVGTATRAVQLVAWTLRESLPRVLVSTSRSASLAAWATRVPAVGLLDYEHAEQRSIALACRSLWFPDLLRGVPLPRPSLRVARFYAGLKENLYLDERRFDRPKVREELGVSERECLVVSRPPAEAAHYASDRSLWLWLELMAGLRDRGGTRVVIVARTTSQRERLRGLMGRGSSVEFLEVVVDGPALVAAADLVVGAGGTMNREAAVLGTPVWSVFAGPPAHIDECLAREGRLRWARSNDEITALLSRPVPEHGPIRGPFPEGRAAILQDIESLATSRRS